MTTITPEQAFKSKQNFSEYLADNTPEIITNTIAEYQNSKGKVVVTIAELTQNIETFLNVVSDDIVQKQTKTPYFVWVITNPKENITKFMRLINEHSKGKLKIFIFKAVLNDDKMDFECLLKPPFKIKSERKVNENTPSKLLQKTLWEKYIDICDQSEHPDMQIKEALPRHYQYVAINKSGVQILQTINTEKNFVASEILINNDKTKFEKLLEHKVEVESEIGTLLWDSKENNKSSKIRKIFSVDLSDSENYEQAVLKLVDMGAELKVIAHKYL